MPFLFWFDIIALCVSTIVAFALAIIVIGSGPRRKLNIYFATLSLLEAGWALCSLLLRFSLWLNMGVPILLLELDTFLFVMMGPVLLFFINHYVEKKDPFIDKIALGGIILIVVLSYPLFNQAVIYHPNLLENGTLAADISFLGYILSGIPALFFIWSLFVFYQTRKKTKEAYLMASVILMLFGYFAGGLINLPFPVLSVTNTVSIIILGLAVVFKQLFNPLNELNQSLKQSLEQLKQTQEQLLQSQKMEALGRLTGGIAHDFNNILTAILGNTETILLIENLDSKIESDLYEIKNAALKASGLIQQLLAFSRKQIQKPELVNINDLILDMQNMFKRLVSEKITLVLNLEPKIGLIRVDPNQLQQVLINLIVNAKDAMPEGGTLTILTQSTPIKDGEITDESPNQTKITVEDTGSGMSEELIPYIFDPFFTTKTDGTGLGLATVHGIVIQNNGSIKVKSIPNQSTLFEIIFPEEVNQKLKKDSKKPVQDQLNVNRGTVLIAEDENIVSKMLVRILKHYGFNVLTAENGDQAYQIFCENKRIQLLITDIIMPGKLNGLLLGRKIREINSDLPVLYISGYTDDLIKKKGIAASDIDILHKPFEQKALINKINQLLTHK